MSILPTLPSNVTQQSGSAPRNCAAAQAICRGVQRLLRTEGFESVCELTLSSGRRVDLMAVGADGEIRVIEVKSSVADFRSDTKWSEYRAYCDRFYFAVDANFPTDLIPSDVGLILADAYGGVTFRTCEKKSLSGARRKALLIAFARCAAMRLTSEYDPMQVSRAMSG